MISPKKWYLPDSVKRLPLTVILRENEPVDSFLFRLAIANGYRSIPTMLRGTPNFTRKLGSGRSHTRDRYIAIASRLGGVAEDELEAATPIRQFTGITLFDHHFRKIASVGKARVCFGCLLEDMTSHTGQEQLQPHRRNWWEIQNIGACPVHAVPLADRCPECHSSFMLIKSTTSCHCNPHLKMHRMRLPTVAPDDLVHDRWLLSRLGILPVQEEIFIDSLPIDVASRLCWIIGIVSERRASAEKNISPGRYSFRERSIGWSVMRNWPFSFERFLDKTLDYYSNIKKIRGNKAAGYGGLIKHLQREDCPELKSVFMAIRSHVTRNQLISPATRIFGQTLEFGENIALAVAAKIAGCGEKRFLGISRALGLPLAEQPAVGTHIVPTSNVEKVKDLVSSSIEVAELARRLGCPPKVVIRLVDNGILSLKFANVSTATDLIDRHQADKLISLISEDLDEIRNLEDHHLTARSASKLVIDGTFGLLAAILSKNIRGIGRVPGAIGLYGMIFDRKEVFDKVNSVYGTILYSDVISIYKWRPSTLRQLRRMGYLDSALRSDYIYTAELEKFMNYHVSLNEMLDWQEAPDNPAAIRQILRQHGVHPSVPSSMKVSAFWPRVAAREALARASSNQSGSVVAGSSARC